MNWRDLITVSLVAGSALLCAEASAQFEDTWDTMMSGIRKYSIEKDIREEFESLCAEHDTASIDGRVETGGGLYMTMDVPVLKKPQGNKSGELPDKTIVVLMGDSLQIDDKAWVHIKFLQISPYNERAVGVEDGWVLETQIRRNRQR